MSSALKLPPPVLLLHDLCSYGSASLKVCLPVFALGGYDPCPLPTALLSMHTGFAETSFLQTEAFLAESLDRLAPLQLPWAGFYSGFLGDLKEIEAITALLRAHPQVPSLVDPVMGDHGRIYRTYTPDLCAGMARLALEADWITPNLTEAAQLAGLPYTGEAPSPHALAQLFEALAHRGYRHVVLTGIVQDDHMAVAWSSKGDGQFDCYSHERSPRAFDGTGDFFASLLGLGLFRGQTMDQVAPWAATLSAKAVAQSEALLGQDPRVGPRGLYFEGVLAEIAITMSPR